jgi:hypothetical protein
MSLLLPRQVVAWFWNGEGDDMRIVMKRYETDLYSVRSVMGVMSVSLIPSR